MRRVQRLAGYLVSLVFLGCTPGSSAELGLTKCGSGQPEGARCGTLRVFENRAAQTGRTIDLNILVLPARNKDSAPDPIFFLHGGPGAPATAMAPMFAGSPLRDRRDIVLVDQRGTGGSNALDCPLQGLVSELRRMADFDYDRIEGCLEKLDADPRLYTTTIAMDDLDDVRRALGAKRINLIGGSYGTRAALEYMRRHGDHLRTAVLRGVFPPSANLPVNFDHDSQAALYRVLDDCAAEPRCAGAYPELRKELTEVLARLEQEPGRVKVRDPFGEGRVEVSVDRDLFVASLHYALYMPQTTARIPSYIHDAHAGEFDAAIGSTVRFLGSLAPLLSVGMMLSVVCAEDAPFYDVEVVERESKDTLLGGRMARSLLRVCAQWPRGEIPEDYKQPVRSDVPTLLLSGETDPVTPPRIAAEVATHLSGSLHIVLPETGHAPMAPGCVDDLVLEFIEAGSVDGIDPACAAKIERPMFATD